MTMFERYDPFSYKPGDPIFVSDGGWRNLSVTEYRVVRITPGGQVVARHLATDAVEIRFTKRGDVMGGASTWDRRHVVSAARAADIRATSREKQQWREIARLGELVNTAARREDMVAVLDQFGKLASAIEARRAETLGSACESAVPQGDAQ